MLDVYKVFFRPTFGYACKYHPTCSSYSKQAVAKRGLFVGSLLTAKRILKCNPFSRGGFDPVPLKEVDNA